MTGQTDSQVADALQTTQQFISAIEDDKFRALSETFTATDETGTVKVTVNGSRWLTGLQIEHGLLRLGAETVKQRINEALREAQAVAIEAAEAEGQQLEDALVAIAGQLLEQLGDLPSE